jgi:hypothetical protein
MSQRKRTYSELADTTWSIWQNENGTYPVDQVKLVLLLDIREELKKLNATLRCQETQRIPRYLRRIANNTAKPRPKKP